MKYCSDKHSINVFSLLQGRAPPVQCRSVAQHVKTTVPALRQIHVHAHLSGESTSAWEKFFAKGAVLPTGLVPSAPRRSVVQHVKTTVLVLHQIRVLVHPNGESNIVMR